MRSRLYLSYPSGTTSGNVRELEGKKLNYGAKGAKLKMRWNRGAFDLIASSTPVHAEAAGAFTAGIVSVEAGVERDILDAVALHPDVRMVLAGKTSPYYAPTVLKKREPDLLVAWTPDEVVAAVERLEAAGVIRSVPIGKDASRRTTYGLRIDADRLSARDAGNAGVFD
ncbi:hypothetical protein [Aureimonas phyllosphaerae]|uniref:Uncharacterized protein n=1 Tax=Aureimonas phyllosphaerae TaxID=1166078 RepID=A0A7W6FWG1_9HYPH|nr:hypothetical protein [Aureimonas phyllosphaerae]MBB3938161.1 hypothetical protein [Aureimonas phyllosphaerae]MBB3962169.1 hypothetical protein [Aureimonas phyllosphaerae]SFF56577.1 hypothetical protein SAMN05216566_13011 [Aureimonas phyllosphaerae]